MPPVDTKILELNRHKMSDKAPFINQAVLEFLIEKIDGYKNNQEKLSSIEVGEHILSGF